METEDEELMGFLIGEASPEYEIHPPLRLEGGASLKGTVVRSFLDPHFIPPTTLEMIAIIQNGIPFEEFEDLQACLDVSKARLADFLGIPKATLQRREAAGRLRSDESDRLIRFARLLGLAVEVFESLDSARRWLNAPQFGLGYAIPLEYAGTEMGAREVEHLLGRIEYGVYS